MPSRLALTVVLCGLLAMTTGVQALTVSVRYDLAGSEFDSDTQQGRWARAAVDSAAAYVSSLFSESLSPILPNPGAGDTWTARRPNPSLESFATEKVTDLEVPEDTVLVYVGVAPISNAEVVARTFPGLAFANEVKGSPSFRDAVLTRGQDPSDGPNGINVTPWGASIQYNQNRVDEWFLQDPDAVPAPGPVDVQGIDLWTFTVHEIVHALGFGVGTYGAGGPVWGKVVEHATFEGAVAQGLYGEPVPLYGPGLESDHWADTVQGTLVDGSGMTQKAVMGKHIPEDQRLYLTDLDVAALQDLGWKVTPVPLPAGWLLFGTAAMALSALRRRAA
jgi:hypothetical protein